MNLVQASRHERVAILELRRGKVNALDAAGVVQLCDHVAALSDDASTDSIVITGSGKFFSFGFDIPELLSFSKEKFKEFVQDFTRLYRDLYICPKPVVAALNGHAIAGGCMLACACDYRLMTRGRAKISLNEVTFGATVFAGSVEMLVGCVGQRNAERVLLSGSMFSAEEALHLGLVDRVTDAEELMPVALEVAGELGGRDSTAFRSIKLLMRDPIASRMLAREARSITEFVDIWYSSSTREKLGRIKIHD